MSIARVLSRKRRTALTTSFKKNQIELARCKVVYQGSMKDTYRGSFTVINEKGLHTRPSTELVRCATSFEAQVTLMYQNHAVNAKSLLDILMLAATRGAKIKVKAI